jgi:hypothetical protein
MPDCFDNNGNVTADITADTKTKMMYSYIVGYCDIGLIYYAKKNYAKSRAMIDACLAVHDGMRAMAQARNWTMFTDYENRFMPLLKQYSKALDDDGYPSTLH